MYKKKKLETHSTAFAFVMLSNSSTKEIVVCLSICQRHKRLSTWPFKNGFQCVISSGYEVFTVPSTVEALCESVIWIKVLKKREWNEKKQNKPDTRRSTTNRSLTNTWAELTLDIDSIVTENGIKWAKQDDQWGWWSGQTHALTKTLTTHLYSLSLLHTCRHTHAFSQLNKQFVWMPSRVCVCETEKNH